MEGLLDLISCSQSSREPSHPMEPDNQIRTSTKLTDVNFSRSASDFLKAARLSSILEKVIVIVLENVVVGYVKTDRNKNARKAVVG